ncbi:Sec-independent protein translocase subunit TatA/TatB [Hymenobacter translucens]|uniref:Sec-independent protein translocase subunit TatA/TatB n=1 Tax=Hymenobacter translucens TaxID=2886507 RepID=UPI00293E4A12|nr:twin-arginine translocase TatA/TatE family subunit [Hymenobacter translucens]
MNTPFLLFLEGIGGGELIVIVLFVLIFFGSKQIPELARGLGKGIREFKDASREIRSEIENAGQPKVPTQQQYSNSYVAPETAPAPLTEPEQPASYAAPETNLAPPMDGGIAPTPTERPRLDQQSN